MKWAAAGAVLAALAWGAWSYLKPEPKPTYLTEQVKRGDIRQTVSAVGEISPESLVDVGAQASGQIKKLYVGLGDTVRKGDLIAEINSTSQMNTLNTNKAQLATYQAQLASAQVALRTAERKYRREQALWAEEATSRESLESMEDALAAAKANVTQLKSSIKQAQISINTAETDLGYTRIIAPMDGTVVAITVEEGQTLNAAQSTPTLIQLANLKTMLNKMQIAEGDITKVKPGQNIRFTILSEPDQPFEAVLDKVDPGLTTMSKGSYSKSTDTTESAIYYYARSLVPNPDGKLAIGMTTQNTIEINSARNVLLVPALAVQQKGGKSTVRVLGEDGLAQEREIATGLKDNMNIEVKSGLKEGEQVVLSERAAGETVSDTGFGPPPR